MASAEVQLPPIMSAALGAGGVTAIWAADGLPPIGWWAALAYLTVSTALLGSTLVVIHTAALDVLLLERADRPGFWQSVTGSQHPGEALRETAIREVAEETGLDATRWPLSDWNLPQSVLAATSRPSWMRRSTAFSIQSETQVATRR